MRRALPLLVGIAFLSIVGCSGSSGTKATCRAVCDSIDKCGSLEAQGFDSQQECREQCHDAVDEAELRSIACADEVEEALDCGADRDTDDACEYVAPYFQTLIGGACESRARSAMNTCFGVDQACFDVCDRIDTCAIAGSLPPNCRNTCQFATFGLFNTTACRQAYVEYLGCLAVASCSDLDMHDSFSELVGVASCSTALADLNTACGF